MFVYTPIKTCNGASNVLALIHRNSLSSNCLLRLRSSSVSRSTPRSYRCPGAFALIGIGEDFIFSAVAYDIAVIVVSDSFSEQSSKFDMIFSVLSIMLRRLLQMKIRHVFYVMLQICWKVTNALHVICKYE